MLGEAPIGLADLPQPLDRAVSAEHQGGAALEPLKAGKVLCIGLARGLLGLARGVEAKGGARRVGIVHQAIS
jgi:hypothetical protein